jgi:hypothetical protein
MLKKIVAGKFVVQAIFFGFMFREVSCAKHPIPNGEFGAVIGKENFSRIGMMPLMHFRTIDNVLQFAGFNINI